MAHVPAADPISACSERQLLMHDIQHLRKCYAEEKQFLLDSGAGARTTHEAMISSLNCREMHRLVAILDRM
jgi:hypothetical protein